MTVTIGAPTTYRRALPRRTPDNAGYFDSLKAHAMKLQKCANGHFRFFPGPICPRCSSLEFEWTPVSGKGTLHTYSWVYRPAPGFEDTIPYCYALVELDEGPVLATNIVDTTPEQLKVGQRVEVVYADVTPEWTLAHFRPVQ